MSSDEWREAKKNMKRKVTFFALCAMLFALCFSAEAQQPKKVPARIGYLYQGDRISDSSRIEAIRLALRELGYIEGQNIAIEYRYAEGENDRFPELAAELVRLKVDVIVVSGGGQLIRAANECDQNDSHRYGRAVGSILSRQAWLKALPVPEATSPALQTLTES